MRPTPPVPPETENENETEKKPFDLSLTQLVGGALAAMTAAYLGSRLSVAGTVVGAAVASMVAGVAGTLYTASLRHTRAKVRSVWTGRTNSTPTEVVVTREATPTPSRPAASAPALGTDGTAEGPAAPMWRTGRFWKRIAIGAVASFALAAAAITGLELVSGQSLDGGQGTTVQRVRQPAADSPSERPSESPSASPSDEPSESPSDEPSQAPSDPGSEAPSEAPSAAPSASDQPSETPTDEGTASGSAAPREPSAAGGDSAAEGADTDPNVG